ncbi:glycosyl transferase family 90 [Neisseria leonii]|uniref:Glycosyl transferase family 90 n=1 Tax=Neisseria leonii TaxID=2995413 RepID=A0A9X4EB56_9NEIS|nr:glycosyl transferase family 90 [Neisseria sp. 51.81]MDD9328748.1 glycosyl transferase family 90 [Neisseria sp. 51.81]
MMSYTDILHQRLHKLHFYAASIPAAWLPHRFLTRPAADAASELAKLPAGLQNHIRERIHYYNRLTTSFTPPPQHSDTAAAFCRKGKSSAYYYDLKKLLKSFPPDQRFGYLFGDITHIPNHPLFVKSRPISGRAVNAVLLKLDSVRHFYTVKDRRTFHSKKDLLVWRGSAHQPHRLRFLEQHHATPSFDVGCVHQNSRNRPYHKNYLTISEQLQYRYILSIEGNDVATNLKWIMASRSVAVMTEPRFETWLMEGRLKPDIHYIHVQDDYADLAEKLAFYRARPAAAEKIADRANAWMQPFFQPRWEWITQILTMQKYFDLLRP